MMTVPIVGPHELGYEDWLTVLDALESDASSQQRDAGQDALQRHAPLLWLDAVERRDAGSEQAQ